MKYTKQDLIKLAKTCVDTPELDCDNNNCPGFKDCNSEELMGAGVPSGWTGQQIESIFESLKAKGLVK